MYKSSLISNFIKYLYPAIFILMVGRMLYYIYFNFDFGSKINIFFLFWLIPIGYFIIQMFVKVKYIEANESEIIIKTLFKKEEVKYSDIEWISKFDIETPFYPTIKYYDKENMKYRKACFISRRQDQRALGFSNDRMTQYLKEQVGKLNPSYSKDNEPSKIKTILAYLIAVGIWFCISFYIIQM